MGIVNTGQPKNINIAGDKLTLSLKASDGSETEFVLEGVLNTLTGNNNGNNGSSETIEPIKVVSAGKGLKFLPPFPTQPVLLGIDKQESFYSQWKGSAIQVFQWDRKPNTNRDGAKWKGEFDPSDKSFIMLLPSEDRPWFTFSLKEGWWGTWDTARVELKENRILYFHDFINTEETWQYEEVSSSPSPNPTPTPGGIDPTNPQQETTYKNGWSPKQNWIFSMTENPIPWNSFGAKTWDDNDLAALKDDDNNTGFTAFNNHSAADIRLIIDLGEEYKNISRVYIAASNDILQKGKGEILISPDNVGWTQVFSSVNSSGYLEGEITFNSIEGRFIQIVTKQDQNLGRSDGNWHIREISVYGDYPT
ncbi:discoidin domain-containing protein [Roseofilum sp. Belize Diploria]|uniref:discoidin domain-containing protein n=1 Tax=Roseofilum sp. Belize Diploria TaxID=2821501 RepID=UPI001B25CB91|nr:discoidin domain-containing protein [Roseofilum sp. Belize Diploria]MBP0008048.1 discoidin domain-containing protein [Roseofilum sp. Belize Diploria]